MFLTCALHRRRFVSRPRRMRRRFLIAACYSGAVAFSVFALRTAPAAAARDSALDARARAQLARIERNLPAETMAACRRVAQNVAAEVDAIFKEKDWESALLDKIEAGLKAEGIAVGDVPVVGQIIAAVLAVIAAVIILIGEIMAKAREEQAAKKEERAEIEGKLQDVLGRTVARLEECEDGELFPRKKP